MTWNEAFEGAYPKAIDFDEEEYLADRDNADLYAVANGYRLAGYRLGRAVFTTKDPAPEKDQAKDEAASVPAHARNPSGPTRDGGT